MRWRNTIAKLAILLFVVASHVVYTKGFCSEVNEIPDVEAYTWYRGCGPTTISMILNYYGKHGFPRLYCKPTSFRWDGPEWWILDLLLHVPYCPRELVDEIADYLGFPKEKGKESDYGCTAEEQKDAILFVVGRRGYDFDVQIDYSHSWEVFKKEIDAMRPVKIDYLYRGFLEEGGHAVCGIGYDYSEGVHRIKYFDTSDRNPHVKVFDQETIYNWVLVAPKVRVDLIFCIDVTGSMWDDIDSVKASATSIVDEISTKVPDWRIAVVSFQDFPVHPYGCEPGDPWNPAGDWPYRAVLPFSTDKTTIINAINSLQALCGWDGPESIYSALIRSINTEDLGVWREGVKKVIILMTDSYPHDPEPFTGYTLADVRSAAAAVDPAVIYPVFIGWNSIARSYAEQIAEATGGKVFYAPTASEVVEAMLGAIAATLKAPIADADGPYKGAVGSPITFDASGSYDPDGDIVSYEWDWDNDGVYDESVTTPTTTHTWDVEFSGTVRLRVTDNDGLTSIDTASVEVTASAVPGDLDGDGQVCRTDLDIILSHRNQPASECPECDLDGDGMITALDARKLVTLCTRPRCACE